MIKKLLVIFLILAITLAAVITYLNSVYLPTKIKSLIIQVLQDYTQKKVSLEAVYIHPLKGLVLKKLTLSDEKRAIISLKEASCTFLVFPLFRKQIILPALRVSSPVIFLERRPDNSFNLQDLFTGKDAPVKKNFDLYIYQIKVSAGTINYQDDTTSPVFTKTAENVNLVISLSLPASVKFKLRSEISVNPAIKISAQGEYKIPQQQFLAKIALQDLSPREFAAYYRATGVTLPEGLIDAQIKIDSKNNLFSLEIDSGIRGLVISADKIRGRLNSGIKANARYNSENKQLTYSGNADLSQLDLSGIPPGETIKNIKGAVRFNQSGLSADKLSATCFGIPVEGAVSLVDFQNPLLKVNLTSPLDLKAAKGILKDKFNFFLPADVSGSGKLFFAIQKAKLPWTALKINGYFDISNANLKLEKLASPVENIQGRIDFSQNQLKWSGLKFKFLSLPYETSGTLTDFQAPGIQFKLSSPELYLESLLAINNKIINVTSCSGRYLNSEFSFSANIDVREANRLPAEVNALLNVNLVDLKKVLPKLKEQLNLLSLAGIVKAQLNLAGNLKQLKSCAIKGSLESSSFSAFGLKAQTFLLDYNQADGLIDLPQVHLSLYGGTLDASAKMNFVSANLPYRFNLKIQDIKIEQLKMDTGSRDKDIAGTVRAEANINGFWGDLSKLSGAGGIFINNGRLWQLNLFKGLGALIFTTDFTKIVFTEGSCAFTVQDNSVFTDNIRMKSSLADLGGAAKIGFDGALKASLDVKVAPDAPVSGTFKDVTTAIIGQAGRFGTIEISGTLKEPKYKFRTAVGDIIKSLKDLFLR